MADGKVVISTALDNSGIAKGIKSVVGTLGGLTKVVAGVTASVGAAFGAAAVAITKQAVDAYADYEQLIGGVETLFKDAADKVAGYAEDAFYTVGISANEYMETVTSFSASLISSLAGDTEKAADVANMALTDMADNANKMGTPLESIKNAYRGFAKQNYTMLDNLKLGYGGTKTEMERLLGDAQKRTGVKYNISNLADVYNAIHAIQVEMRIAGTTAKEAEKTITGSANMTKAAWKNVLAAIAGGGDLDKAINNLVYSVSRYFDNIVPVVERSLAGIGQMIEQVAPQLVETVAAALIKAIPSLLNAVYKMIIGLANGVYQGVAALFSGSTKEIAAQLNSVDKMADNLNGAANGAKNLAQATEEAGKAAKKSLAPFDEIAKLSGTDVSSFSGNASSGSTNSSVVVDGEVKDELTQKVEGILQSIAERAEELFEPLREIDFSPVMAAFSNLKTSLEPLTATLFEGLERAYTNVLVPLAAWTIEDLLPAFLDLLSGALDVLNAMIETFKPLAEWLWDNFLEPIAEWTGGVIVDVLGDIADGLTDVSDWIANHQGAVLTMTGICAAFMAVWKITDLVMWVDKAGGVVKVLKLLRLEFVKNTAAKIASKAEDIAIIAMYAKDYIVAFGKMIVQLATSTASWVANTAAKVASTAAEWAQIAATTAWNAICAVATTVTTAFGAAVAFLTSPIGLVILAIGALIAIVVLLVKNWDTVKETAKNVWDGVKSVWNTVANWFKEHVTDPIGKFFKNMVNGVIGFINGMISAVVSGINFIIRALNSLSFDVPDWVPGIGGQTWGFNISEVKPPQIPYLAKGAVLPPNKPFMAVVGDQTHGTNVEAPLATIQEAVAIVMEDMIRSNIAGHEATVAVLREILEAVLGIHIGDDVIGQAVARYNAKMAIIRGGA